MDGYHFSVDVRVRFSETDAQGIANNAVYLNWFEVARVTYLARFPGGYRGLIEKGVEVSEIDEHQMGIKYVAFSDPDGNSWVFQEMPWRSAEFNT